MKLQRSPSSRFTALALLALATPALAQGPVSAVPAPAAPPAAAPPAAGAPPGVAPAAPQAPSGPVLPLAESLTGMARAEYAAARILYDDGDFQGALTKLKSAFELSKDPRLLWNMAACEKNLRHYALALVLVERYLAEGGALVSAEDKAAADAFVETIRGFVADLTVEVSQSGADVFLDGQTVGTSPLPAPVKVDMGVHEIRVKKAGFLDFVLAQDLPGGRAVGVTATLVEERHEGKLRVVAGPQDVIQVDGKTVGTGLWEAVLPSGTHTVHVNAKGKLPFRTDVVVRDNDLSSLQVNLQDEAKPMVVVQKEGVPVWVWITGGVLAAGAGVGAYFLLKPGEDEEFRAPQQGTWGAIDL